jgi:membrane protein YfhO
MRRARAAIVLGLAMGAAAAALVTWSGGFGARTNGEDLYVAFLPKHAYIAAALRAGRFPLWNPFEYCGLPLHGVAQGSALYAPIVAANLVLPPLPAIRLVYHLHIAVFLALVLGYLVRDGIALAAAAGGAAIAAAGAFNGIDLGPIDHPHFFFAGVWLLPILLAWDATIAGRAWGPVALALAAGVQWLPGYPEVPVETAMLVAVVAALGPRARLVRRLVLAGVLLAVGAMLAGAQLVPLGETVAQSVRVDDAGTFAFTRHLLFAVKGVPDLADQLLGRYGGAALFALLLGAVVPSARRIAWVVAFLWCTFPVNAPFVYLYDVWPLAGFRFAFGWNMMAAFFAGFLVASGLNALRREPADVPRWAPPALAAAVAAFAFGVGAWWQGAAALACGVASWPAVARRAWYVPLALVLVHAATVFGRIGTMPHFPAPDAAALLPRAAALARLRDATPGEPRVAAGPELRAGLTLPFRLASPDGYEPAVAPSRVARLGRHLGLDAMSWGAENLLDTWHRMVASPGAARALGIGIVPARALQAEPLLAAGYRKVADLPDGALALVQNAPARFEVVHRAVAAADEEASFRAVIDPSFDPGTTVVLESPVPAVGTPPSDAAPEDVRVVEDTPELIRLATTLAAPGVLVVRDTWFPGWEARVDGRRAPILRANHAFRALALGPGTHAVELAYRPLSFRLGIALSLTGLALAAGIHRARRRIVRWVAGA